MKFGNHYTFSQCIESIENVIPIFGFIEVKISDSEKEQPVIEITEFLW